MRAHLDSARSADRAQGLETDKKPAQALTAWRLVKTQFPGTPASTLADTRIAALEKAGVTAKTAPKTSKPAKTSSQDERRAASQLKLGKILLKRNPTKAKAYFERAIKLAPNSKAAAEARKLLKQL